MDEKRARRYLDKIKLVERRMEQIKEWAGDVLHDEKTKLAYYKAVQEVAEACADLAAMLLKDAGKIPKDDYENYNALALEKFINENTCSLLKELNGLRNRVVHEYNGLKDILVVKSMERVEKGVFDFIERVEEWLKKSWR